jgi:CHASE3 domain sensor protein
MEGLKMFKQMKLASKLYLGFGIVVVIAAVLGYMGWSSLGKV